MIISIIVDDLGSFDMGFKNGQIQTPAFDRLRGEGYHLPRMYVQPICTPTRSSFLTSRYALALGLQGKQTVQQGCSWGLGLNESTFVSQFQRQGWRTHMVGKAHLGADYWRRTPTFRGFNTFFGYLYGAEDYFNHTLGGFGGAYYDFRNDTQPSCGPGCSKAIGASIRGTYSTFVFGAEVARLIAAAGASQQPTYIHFTPQSVHAPNQAPESYVAPYRSIFGPSNPIRAIHAGALAVLDEALANITSAIAAAGLLDDTLIFVSADNGGPLGPTGDGTMASNYPRRGGKHSLYEGGVQAESFVWGPKWLGTGVNRTWEGLCHTTDVGLTLMEAAGLPTAPYLPTRHGVSFWGALSSGQPRSLRQSVVVNIDYTQEGAGPQAAIVTRDGMKLILGSGGDSSCDYWSDPVGEKTSPPPGRPPLLGHPAAAVPGRETRFPTAAPTAPSPLWPLGNMAPTLYNLTADPRETTNLTQQHPDLVAALLQELQTWGSMVAVPVVENPQQDPLSNPKFFNDSWTPWLGL